MELRDLEYFLAVVEAGSISHGAQRVGRSQQAISKSLARLEQSLGVRLLERTAKGIVPTVLGQSLVLRAQVMVAESARFRREVELTTARSGGHLAIGVSPTAAARIASTAVARFRIIYPGIRVTVDAGLEHNFSRKLIGGDLDLAIAASNDTADSRLAVEEIAEESWLVAGRAGNPLIDRARSLGDLIPAEWIYGEVPRPLQLRIDRSFASVGVEPPRPAVATYSLEFALSLLARSDLLAILPGSIVAEHRQLRGRDFEEARWRTPLVVMRRRRAAPSPLEVRMVELLRSAAIFGESHPIDVENDKRL